MNHLFVAGFDFGTSCSKVVLRDQFTKDLAKPVTFGESRVGLLPSMVTFDGRKVHGPLTPTDAPRIAYLKLLAADAATGQREYETLYQTDDLQGIPESDVLLCRYFLSVIQGILSFLASDPHWLNADISRDPLVLQLAVPTGLMRGDSVLEELMARTLRAAYLMAIEGGIREDGSTVESLQEWLALEEGQSPEERDELKKRCLIYPEVAGGVQTVLRAKNYPEGKYITMDIGAGTVDMNVFYRQKRDSSRDVHTGSLDYWSSKVAPLGCARISGRSAARATHETVRHEFDEHDLKRHLQILIRSLMSRAFDYQPYKVHGTGPSPWLSGTQVFIFGGGSSIPAYSETLVSSLQSMGLGIVDVEQLPEPGPGFELPGDVPHFGRFAVAFGLSYHMADLETIRLSSELETFKERYPDVLTEPDRANDVGCTCFGNPSCPRCAGTGIVKLELSIQANIGSLIIEASQRAGRKSVSSMGPEATELNRLIDLYYQQRGRLDFVDRYVLLKRIQTLRRLSAGKSYGKIREDAFNLLAKASRTTRSRIKILPGDAEATQHGIRVKVLSNRLTCIRIHFLAKDSRKIEQRVNRPEAPAQHLPAGLKMNGDRINAVLQPASTKRRRK